MSWDIFKQRMTDYGKNQNSVSIEGYAKKLTSEYDSCIRRGHDTVNFTPIQKGNTELMFTILLNTFQSQQRISKQTSLLRNIGTSVIAYWTGAIMSSFPVPTSPVGAGIPWIPAPGSVFNVNINSNIVTNPGQWTLDLQVVPTTNETGWLNLFISIARVHLNTISGLITTTSLYPPTGTPAPGIIIWTGYTIK